MNATIIKQKSSYGNMNWLMLIQGTLGNSRQWFKHKKEAEQALINFNERDKDKYTRNNR